MKEKVLVRLWSNSKSKKKKNLFLCRKWLTFEQSQLSTTKQSTKCFFMLPCVCSITHPKRHTWLSSFAPLFCSHYKSFWCDLAVICHWTVAWQHAWDIVLLSCIKTHFWTFCSHVVIKIFPFAKKKKLHYSVMTLQDAIIVVWCFSCWVMHPLYGMQGIHWWLA